ncbi:hypothetical protein Mpet_1649 [Methanolacinia petrolearia DSM 11571]|uniref:Uncharacterized protein n=1 Tax=Methanolacinia petrolearia (strain DSM 11571 / OCM 486 / SEBR 4847) TaxID=679926 RepID=E1RH98_METP4|nr:hypothetical protein [Methanolacinia petrolearia]ADN36402.1 hypothetical protein Mpet_1649 [Methanolacinia petrolearia DSM 11571]
MDAQKKDQDKKRPRLPPSLKDIVYIAVISNPAPGKSSNFEVYAITMSAFSIIKLKYSRKTRLSPGMVIDLRDFGEMSHYTIEDDIPFDKIAERDRNFIGKALVSAGEKHPIGLLKAQTMAEEGIENLFRLLNMNDPERLAVFLKGVQESSFEGEVTHRDLFAIFIRAFSGAKKPPDVRQQEALISICGNNPAVIIELAEAYLDYAGKN